MGLFTQSLHESGSSGRSASTCSRGLQACFSSSRSLSQGSANATVLDVAQTGGHKKRVRRSSFLNAKKLYEDAQMARKVKQYLSNLELEMDEESLQTLSLQCEPATSTCECLPKSAADGSDVQMCNGEGQMGARSNKARSAVPEAHSPCA